MAFTTPLGQDLTTHPLTKHRASATRVLCGSGNNLLTHHPQLPGCEESLLGFDVVLAANKSSCHVLKTLRV
eukprot:5543713-Amphidinium_carterae.1